MKKFLKRQVLFTVVVCLALSLLLSLVVFASNSLSDKLAGKILLQVENNGEAWYVSPQDKTRSFLGRPEDAFSVMRSQGIGISNDNLNKIVISLDNLSGEDSDGDGLPDMFEDAVGTDKNKQDSDSDGYNDKEELQNNYDPMGLGKLNLDANFQDKQKGKIFLQVENNGEAWYVSPQDGRRHFLGRPNDAFSVMRSQGLGISNSDIEQININKELDYEPKPNIEIDDKQFSTYAELIDFAKNISRDCRPGSTIIFNDKESDSPDFDYKITTKGKKDKTFCNMQIEILNIPDFKDKDMTCSFETITDMKGSTDEEYYMFIEFLPVMIYFGYSDKEYCQGDLTQVISNEKYAPISESDFEGFEKVDVGSIQGVSKGIDDDIYYLKQGLNNKTNLYKYNNDISLIDSSDIQNKNSLFIDSQNKFYTWDGVAGFSEGNGGLYKYDSEWKEIEKFSDKQIISVTENNEGLWVATPDALYLLNKSNIWTEYKAGDWGGSDDHSIKVIKGHGNYLLFQAGFNFYMYRDSSFEKLNIDNLDILQDMSGNVYIEDNIAWFYSTWFTGGKGLAKVNLDDHSYEKYLISSPKDGISNDNMVIDSIVSGNDNDFWFLSHNYNNKDGGDSYIVISHYKNKTLTHSKYKSTSGNIDRYADTLVFRNNNLYII